MTASFEVEVKELAAYRVASQRVKGRYEDFGRYIGPLFRQFGRWAAGPPLSFYYDAEYKAGEADFEPAFPVKAGAPAEGTRLVPACRAACLIHQGPYDSLHASYEKMAAYLQANGLTVEGPTREVYLKGPGMIFRGNPAKYRTEIQFPLKP